MGVEHHQSYPLAWPAGWPRARSQSRATFKNSRRALEVAEGVDRVYRELERFGVKVDHIIVSSNIRPTIGGRGSITQVNDTGVAVYWRDKNAKDRVMAVDRYDRVADNLAAIAATLDAMRAIERHGGAQILDRAFTGFTALAGPSSARAWHAVLGLTQEATAEQVKAAYLRLRSKTHSDKGAEGDAQFIEVQKAYEQACAELGAT